MSNFKELEHRFNNDAVFNHLVTALEALIQNLELSPSEVRDAAMFAVIRFELPNIRPVIFDDKLLAEFRKRFP